MLVLNFEIFSSMTIKVHDPGETLMSKMHLHGLTSFSIYRKDLDVSEDRMIVIGAYLRLKK